MLKIIPKLGKGTRVEIAQHYAGHLDAAVFGRFGTVIDVAKKGEERMFKVKLDKFRRPMWFYFVKAIPFAPRLQPQTRRPK